MKPGDIILRHSGTSLLAKTITHFMDEELGDKELDYPTPHHAGTIIEYKGQLRVAEALGKGYVAQPLLEAYTRREWMNDIVLLTPIVEYTKEQQQLISDTALDMALHSVPYDVPNFIFQIIYVKTGIWLGPTGQKAKLKVYCSEGAAQLGNLVQSWVFPKPYLVNPVMIALDSNFRIESIGVKL